MLTAKVATPIIDAHYLRKQRLNVNFTPLEQDGLLHITGPDSLKFLQGQTTCDTRNINAQHAAPGVFCTPQGRVVCDFVLCELGPEHYALRMRQEIIALSSAALGKYIIFSKAKLDDSRDDWMVCAAWGEHAAPVLREIFGDTPTSAFACVTGDGFAVVQLDEQAQHFECYLSKALSQQYLDRMAELMQASSESAWQAQQIAAGIARIELTLVEEFVPQVLNYDITGHISFNKGCYTGQEVIARLHYRGKPKRRTYLAHIPSGITCASGTPLYDAGSGQEAGSIVNSCIGNDETSALVTATASAIDNGLLLGSPSGPALRIGALPYPVATA
jgi:folate-binding protein YgfZ